MKFERKSKISGSWDKDSVKISFCPDYKKGFFSGRCRLGQECKNAKKIRGTLVDEASGQVSVTSYQIECNGKMFVCNNCKKEFITHAEAATCYLNHKKEK